MNKLRVLLSMLFFNLLSVSVSMAQTTNSCVVDILTGSIWEHTYELSKDVVFESEYVFTSTMFEEIVTYNGEESKNPFVYYLSDNPEFEFDNNKVGKARDGKYIISKNKTGGIFVQKIVSLSKTEFCFLAVSNKGKARCGQPIIYKGILK